MISPSMSRRIVRDLAAADASPPAGAAFRQREGIAPCIGWELQEQCKSVEGDHSIMVSAPNADSTAASLTRCLFKQLAH